MGRRPVSVYCQQDNHGVLFRVHLTPRASQEDVGGLHGDAVKVRVKAPPVDGKANDALVKLLAKTLGVGRSRLEIVSGQTSRTKLLRVEGMSPAEVMDRLQRE